MHRFFLHNVVYMLRSRSWLGTVHSGDWYLRSALRILSGACQKWWWWCCLLIELAIWSIRAVCQLKRRASHLTTVALLYTYCTGWWWDGRRRERRCFSCTSCCCCCCGAWRSSTSGHHVSRLDFHSLFHFITGTSTTTPCQCQLIYDAITMSLAAAQYAASRDRVAKNPGLFLRSPARWVLGVWGV